MEVELSIDDANLEDTTMSVGFFSFSSPEKQGWLTKQGGRIKNWKRRWFVLKENRMYYYKSPKDTDPLGFIPLERCAMRLVKVSGSKKHCFEIYDPKQPFSKNHPSFFIYADNSEELQEWMRILKLKEEESQAKADELVIEKEGWLVKRGGIVKNWKKRWFILKGNFLYYYRNPNDLYEALGFIPIDRASVNVVEHKKFKRPNCFEITDPSNSFNKWHKSYYICASSTEEMNQWMNAILHKTSTNTSTASSTNENIQSQSQSQNRSIFQQVHNAHGSSYEPQSPILRAISRIVSNDDDEVVLLPTILSTEKEESGDNKNKGATPFQSMPNSLAGTLRDNSHNNENSNSESARPKVTFVGVDSSIGSSRQSVHSEMSDDELTKKLGLPSHIIQMIKYLDIHKINGMDFIDSPTKMSSLLQSKELVSLRKAIDMFSADSQDPSVAVNNSFILEEALEECSNPLYVIFLLFECLERVYSDHPLIPYDVCKELIATHGIDIDIQIKKIFTILQGLPHSTRFSLEFLLAFIGRLNDRHDMLVAKEKEAVTPSTSPTMEVISESMAMVNVLTPVVKLFAPFIVRTNKEINKKTHPVLELTIESKQTTDNNALNSAQLDLDEVLNELSVMATSAREGSRIFEPLSDEAKAADITKKMIKEFDHLFLSFIDLS